MPGRLLFRFEFSLESSSKHSRAIYFYSLIHSIPNYYLLAKNQFANTNLRTIISFVPSLAFSASQKRAERRIKPLQNIDHGEDKHPQPADKPKSLGEGIKYFER